MWAEEVYQKDQKGSIQNEEPYEMLNRAKPLSNNNTWAEESQRKSPKMNQSNWKEALQKQLWEEQSPTKCLKEQQNH